MRNFCLVILLFLFLISGACLTRTKIPPEIPSIETVNFDFSFFEKNHKENTNFSFTSEKVLGWQAFLEDTIMIHNILINKVLQTDFDYQKENTWLSNFSFNINNSDKYYAKFFGITDADTVRYKAFVSYDTISEIIYIDGSAYDSVKKGEWIFNEPIVIDYEYTNSKIMTVSWNFVNKKHLKFTNNQAGSNNLDFIYYIDSIDGEYNAYLDVYNKGDENHSFIQWSKTKNNGRVRDNIRFGDDNWHYWDTNFQDIN